MSTGGQVPKHGVPAWAGQRDATVEQRALQVEAQLDRMGVLLTGNLRARFRHELRSALAATWDDGETCGERTRLQPTQGVGVKQVPTLLQTPVEETLPNSGPSWDAP